MDRELKIHRLEPVLIEPDQIGLDIEAALVQCDDGVDFALPNVTFEVKIGVRKVYEKKSDAKTGQFSAKNIAVGKVESQFEVVISARDAIGGLTVRVQKNAENVIREIEERRRAEERRKAEEAEGRKKDKKAGPENRWSNAGSRSPEEADAHESAAEEAEKQRQAKAEIAEALKFVSLAPHCYQVPGVFGALLKHQNHPAARRGMLEAAKKSPSELTRNVEYFFTAAWAGEVISVLASLKPAAVLEKFPLFYKCPWSRNIAMQIAAESPLEAFAGIVHYEYQPWAHEVALKAAARDPYAAIKFHPDYQDQPWADEVLQFAREEKPRKDEERRKVDKAKRREVDEAMRIVHAERKKVEEAEKKTRKAREAAEEAAKWTKESLMQRAGNDPHGVMMDFEKFGNESWAGEVVSEIAGITRTRTAYGDPERAYGSAYVLDNFNKYSGKPWARDVLVTIAYGDDFDVLMDDSYFKAYMNQSWAADVFELAAKRALVTALKSADFSHPILGKTYEKLASTHTEEFLIYYKPPVGEYGRELSMWTDILKSTTSHYTLASALTTHHGESRKMLFRRLAVIDPQKAIDYFSSNYHLANQCNHCSGEEYAELRSLIIAEFPHLLALISDWESRTFLEEEAGRANPLFAVRKFFRDLFK